jgi:hypothetical protein
MRVTDFPALFHQPPKNRESKMLAAAAVADNLLPPVEKSDVSDWKSVGGNRKILEGQR